MNQTEHNWHSLASDKVFQTFNSGPDGLDEAEAKKRFEQYGPNLLAESRGTTITELVLKQLKSPLIYLLGAAAIVSLLTGHYVDAGVIGAVVVLNTIIGTLQEHRAERAIESLRAMTAPKATVLRDGNIKSIEADDLIPGDILILEAGDKVGADGRLFEINELQTDESAFTGESQPAIKSTKQVPADSAIADRSDMVWMSTTVTNGRGKAIVTATGMNTEMGHIAGQVQQTKREITPLQKRLNKLGVIMGVASVILSSIIFILGVTQGHGITKMVLYAIAAAVSSIPEGLPAVISVVLAMGMHRMAKQNAIVRRLSAVETLGSTTVICSDKTGTITKNQMTIEAIYSAGKEYSLSGTGYDPAGEISIDSKTAADIPQSLKMLLTIGVCNNNALLMQENGRWNVKGDPTEGAMLTAAQKSGLNIDAIRDKNIRLDELPFSSETKYMATLNVIDSRKMLLVKGAPEQVISICKKYSTDDQNKPLDSAGLKQINQEYARLASKGMRVLAGAYKEMPQGQTDINVADDLSEMIFAGLWGMIDPARPEAIEAIARAQGAGIKIIMITGDHGVTASAIASQIGISKEGTKALSGKDIEELDIEQLAVRAMQAKVIARVAPNHKLKITESLKRSGEIVAMTGDGVNDAPALKGADIGIAMGKTGTDVAKEAADMVLADDNFATIVRAISEGRLIFANLQRVIFFLITTSVTEMFALLSALTMQLPLPVTAVMILWINLITDGIATIPLGLEKSHKDMLEDKPRPPKEPIVNSYLMVRILILASVAAAGTLFVYTMDLKTGSYSHSQTMAFTTIAAFQWFQSFNARSRKYSIIKIGPFTNRLLILNITLGVILQLFVIYTPIGRMLFHTTALSGWDWGVIAGTSICILFMDEICKALNIYARITGAQGKD